MPKNTSAPSTGVVHGALILVQVLFGLWPVAGLWAMRSMSPPALVGVRTLGATPVLLGFALLRAQRLPTARELLSLAGLAFLGISLNQLLFAEGLRRAGAINAVVLSALIPVLTLLAGMALGRESPPWSRRLGILVALLGVLVLVGAERFELRSERMFGNLLILANSTSYAFYLVYARPVIGRLGALSAIGWIFLFGALEALPFTAPAMASVAWSSLDSTTIGSLVFIVLGPTIASYFLNAFALKYAESSLVATYAGLQPLVGTLAAAITLGEALSLRTASAALAIVGGVVWACSGTRRAAASGAGQT